MDLNCFSCGNDVSGNIDAYTGKNVEPDPGDITMCGQCGLLQVICDCGKHLRPATPEDLDKVDPNYILAMQMRVTGGNN